MSAIEIERDAGALAERSPAARIMIDGILRGYVMHGEAQLFDVAPGVHTVKIAVPEADCPPVKVVVGAGRTTLLCATKQRRSLVGITLSAARTTITVREDSEGATLAVLPTGERLLPVGSAPAPKAFLRAQAKRMGEMAA